MKTILQKTTTIFFAVILISSSVHAANPESQTRNVGQFAKISVSSGIDLYLSQGDQIAVKVEAESNHLDEIITSVEGETLKIYIKNRNNWNWGWNKPRKVYVTFKQLTSIDASAGADVTAKDKLNFNEISFSASSGADIHIDKLGASSVRVSTSSGADAELAGTTNELVADSSSGSDIDCSQLQAQSCTASASSGGDLVVWVSDSLSANASSGGDIEYKGDPKQKNIHESSGGDVNRR